MSAAAPLATGANGPAFTKFGAFVLVTAGFALFIALLYLIGSGEEIGDSEGRGGQAHAASNGINGYSGLVRLVEAEGFDTERSRNPGGLETRGLLVLTPGPYSEAEEIAEIIKDRKYRGPTLVIMPKWQAIAPMEFMPAQVREKFKRGWVILLGAQPAGWAEELPAPYNFRHQSTAERPKAVPAPEKIPPAKPGTWRGLGLSGRLPAAPTLHAEPLSRHDVLIADSAGRTLGFAVNFARASNAGAGPNAPIVAYNAQPVVFLAEPDLANNYGLADKTRAAAAVALVTQLADEADSDTVTFDMTLNGFGASENLLTLAFRPPFLAATLCLIAALLIVGWRAFQRFGPAAASGGPDIAFGKRQLITNGAGLILRARRFRLLARPYAALSARRLAERMGLARPDTEAIDAALARRLPDEEPYTRRAARLEAASKPADILAAAKALDDLNRKLS